MAYQALYRAYRPRRFDDVVGQAPLVRVLRSQVAAGRIGHAYLFCGPRGVGKTTVARIFARAVNCRDPQDGNPCGQCDACRALEPDGGMDIIEMDGASNNKIDDIRELRSNISYLPSVGRYRVYIVDEVHMLSESAFNGLLKTLEEPPEHGLFILATTEPHKLPATVLSRCQRFNFGRIAAPELTALLRAVADAQGARVEDAGLSAIARASEGGARDALSLLDQCLALGGEVTAQDVYTMLGTVDQRYHSALADAMLRGDISRALAGLSRMFDLGCDAQTLTAEMTRYFRDLFIAMHAGVEPVLADEVSAARLRQQTQAASPADVLRILELMTPLEGALRYAAAPRVLVELAVAQGCRRQQAADTQGLLTRLEKLEAALAARPAAPTDLPAPAVQASPPSRDVPPEPAAPALDPPPWDPEADAPPPEPLPEDPREEPAMGPQEMPPEDPREEPVMDTAQTPDPPPPQQPAPAAMPLSALWSQAIGAMEGEGYKATVSLMRAAKPVELTDTQLKVTLPPGATTQLKALSSATNSDRLARYFSQALGRRIRFCVQLQQVDAVQQRFIDQSTQDLMALAGTVRVLDDQLQEE